MSDTNIPSNQFTGSLVGTGLQKLVEELGKRWFDPRTRAESAMELVSKLYPSYSEPVRAMLAARVLEVLDLASVEHSWDCPGEECRYQRACLEGNARRNGYGG
jgi:hypothetical protein